VHYDPLLAKVITHGRDRDEARRRMLRALGEYEVEGIATTVPFHLRMLADRRFVEGDYHTGTVEGELDLSSLRRPRPASPRPGEPAVAERSFVLELDGQRFEVTARERLTTTVRPPKPEPPESGRAIGGGGSEVLSAPMQGTIVKVLVREGDEVEPGQAVCVLEAMKMENSIVAHTAGTIAEMRVQAGASVEPGAALAIIR
jgi:acetyl-CoA/propionyl-CoA carboxylase biotin carboxyl carrier protein